VNNYSTFVPFRVNIKVSKLEALIDHLEKNGVQTRRMFYPLHRQPCFSYLNYQEDQFPGANQAYLKGMSLAIHCHLTQQNIEYICNKISEFYRS